MSTEYLAEVRRGQKADRNRRAVLAGGWGWKAQQAAWDAEWPKWREMIKAVCSGAPFDAEQDRLSIHVSSRPYLRRSWQRLLMQSMHRTHDQLNLAPEFGRWGGYPL